MSIRKFLASIVSSSAAGRTDASARSQIRKNSIQELPSSLVQEAIRTQLMYWAPRKDLVSRLTSESLSHPASNDVLRLIHLNCQLVILGELGAGQGPKSPVTLEASVAGDGWNRISELLHILDSLKRRPHPCTATVSYATHDNTPVRQISGTLNNASCSHHECLEVYPLREDSGIDSPKFIPFEELCEVSFSGTSLFRTASLMYKGGRTAEIALVPTLYGLTCIGGSPQERAGRYTRFVRPTGVKPKDSDLAIGIGQQDFVIKNQKVAILGVGSVSHISFEDTAGAV